MIFKRSSIPGAAQAPAPRGQLAYSIYGSNPASFGVDPQQAAAQSSKNAAYRSNQALAYRQKAMKNVVTPKQTDFGSQEP